MEDELIEDDESETEEQHPSSRKKSEIAKDLHRFRVLNCGRRFGKTVLAVEEMVGVALANIPKIQIPWWRKVWITLRKIIKLVY